MADNIYLETRVGRNQTHEPFDDEAEEQGESGHELMTQWWWWNDDEMSLTRRCRSSSEPWTASCASASGHRGGSCLQPPSVGAPHWSIFASHGSHQGRIILVSPLIRRSSRSAGSPGLSGTGTWTLYSTSLKHRMDPQKCFRQKAKWIPGGYKGDKEEKDDANLGIKEAGNQSPVDAHDAPLSEMSVQVTNYLIQVLSPSVTIRVRWPACGAACAVISVVWVQLFTGCCCALPPSAQ